MICTRTQLLTTFFSVIFRLVLRNGLGIGHHLHRRSTRPAVSDGEIVDLFSHMMVGWALSSSLSHEMVVTVLKRAIRDRHPGEGLIFHSDRGGQYACKDFRKELDTYGFIQSMWRKGNCWDNAVAESFFSIIKSERIHHERFMGPQDTLASIFEYIEVYYNRKRKHATLFYQTPEQFEQAMKSAGCF
jgi:putative transposase